MISQKLTGARVVGLGRAWAEADGGDDEGPGEGARFAAMAIARAFWLPLLLLTPLAFLKRRRQN